MANTDKRVDKGVEALHSVFTDALMTMPEFVNSPNFEKAMDYFEKSGKEIFRMAVRTRPEPYGEYLETKGTTKELADRVTAEISKFTDLSEESVKTIGAAAGAGIELLRKGEVEIPPQTVTFTGGDVTVGGSVNPKDKTYRADLAGKIEDPFGIEGLTVRGEATGSMDQPFRNVNVGASYEVGDASTLSFGVDPINKTATLGFKTTFKKGGKVKKKRKNKKYAKGCVVRAAKY
jgi:hypothetical protein